MKLAYKNDKISKSMNKILNNLYIFSKLTTTLVLFSLLILLSYLFYQAYKSQNKPRIDLDNKLSSVFDSIQSNTQNLNILKNETISSSKAIKEIEKSLNTNGEFLKQDKLDLLISENKILKERIDIITKQLSEINTSIYEKNNNNVKNYDDDFNKLLNIINLKYENGFDVSNEVMSLKNFNNKIDNESTYEKLSILSKNNFIGLENLNNIFENSKQEYLNHKFLKKNNNAFIRFFSNYIDVEPAKMLDYENHTLKIISQAKNEIEKKNIKLSLEKILSLSDSELFFKLWVQQAKVYIEFKTTLNQITDKNA